MIFDIFEVIRGKWCDNFHIYFFFSNVQWFILFFKSSKLKTKIFHEPKPFARRTEVWKCWVHEASRICSLLMSWEMTDRSTLFMGMHPIDWWGLWSYLTVDGAANFSFQVPILSDLTYQIWILSQVSPSLQIHKL